MSNKKFDPRLTIDAIEFDNAFDKSYPLFIQFVLILTLNRFNDAHKGNSLLFHSLHDMLVLKVEAALLV